ncbi:MAG TPA: DUF3047 domain-containing protein [Candidatus Binatia bacterium]|jgi:hypothetical protein
MVQLSFRALLLIVAIAIVFLSAAGAFAGSAEDCLALDDFSSSPLNSFPSGWTAREEAGKKVYSVMKEGDTVFLRARATGPRSAGNGIEADRQVKWNLQEYPVLRWRWRPRTFPRGANEQSGKDDSVLGVYVGFCPPADLKLCERSVKGQLTMTDRIMLPKLLLSSGSGSLKYIWSEALPKGLEFDSGRKAVKVLESGPAANASQWVEERVDVAADYRRRFRSEKLLDPIGISILTDADDTQSVAEGDYADFRICRQ